MGKVHWYRAIATSCEVMLRNFIISCALTLKFVCEIQINFDLAVLPKVGNNSEKIYSKEGFFKICNSAFCQ